MPPRLPQELIDRIIDALAESVAHSSPARQTLAICGLVSRNWVGRSRFQLFRRVYLGEKKSRLSTFVDIVNGRPTILSIIRHIDLHLADDPFDTSLLERIQPCINLVSIRIYVTASSASIRKAVDTRLVALCPQLENWANLSSASVSRVAFHRFDNGARIPLSMSTFARLLSCFPSLQSLSLDSGFKVNDLASISIPFSRGLRDLTIYGNTFPPVIFSRLVALPSTPHLTSLVLHELDLEKGSIQAYFRHAGGRLESLTLDPHPHSADSIPSLLQYTSTKLREFTFYAKRPRQMLSILPSLPPSDWICITLFVAPFADAEIPWAALDQALSDDRFASLRTFRVQRRLDLQTFQNLIVPRSRRWMPRANARGILG